MTYIPIGSHPVPPLHFTGEKTETWTGSVIYSLSYGAEAQWAQGLSL